MVVRQSSRAGSSLGWLRAGARTHGRFDVTGQPTIRILVIPAHHHVLARVPPSDRGSESNLRAFLHQPGRSASTLRLVNTTRARIWFSIAGCRGTPEPAGGIVELAGIHNPLLTKDHAALASQAFYGITLQSKICNLQSEFNSIPDRDRKKGGPEKARPVSVHFRATDPLCQ
jgi:hypothetical protein